MSSNEFHAHKSEEDTSEFTTKLGDDLSPEEIIERLRSYGPERLEPVYFYDLVKEFQECVQNDPVEFSKLASRIIKLHPEYVCAFFNAIENAIKPKLGIDWEQILSLCEKIMMTRNQSKSRHYNIFLSIARAIHEGLRRNSIEFRLEGRVWNLVVGLVELENTNPSMEESYPSMYQDSFSISLNTLNGVAFHSLLDYANWCDKNDDKTFLPKVKRLFSDYLEHKIKPSVSRHAILGYYLQTLYYFDKEWIRDRLDELFTSASDLLSRSAWDGYLASYAYNDTFTYTFIDLIDKYNAHIQKLNDLSLKDGQLEEIDQRVIEHVTLAYLFKVGGAKKVFDDMILHSHEKVVSHCARYVHSVLINQKNKPNDFFDVNAFKEIWRNSKLPTEKELPNWFRYSPLDKKETLELLYDSLKKFDDDVDIPFPVKELIPHAKSEPELTLKCLSALIEKKREGWVQCNTVYDFKDLLRILQDDARSMDGAILLIYRLLDFGFIGLEDLVPRQA